VGDVLAKTGPVIMLMQRLERGRSMHVECGYDFGGKRYQLETQVTFRHFVASCVKRLVYLDCANEGCA
jgi:hypothetical protein